MCCLPDSHLHSSASIWGEHSVPPISADWEIILYYILEDVLCARHLAKCFLRALSCLYPLTTAILILQRKKSRQVPC